MSNPCNHEYHYYAATNEDGWRCVFCKDRPGEPAGFCPELDRKRLHAKVFALLTTLHEADLIYISNGGMGESIINAVEARCLNEKLYDQYSIQLFILELLTDSHAKYWAEVSEAIVAGKDTRARCHCGKLATVSSGKNRWCSEHWDTDDH